MEHCEECNTIMPAHNSKTFGAFQDLCQQCRLIEAIQNVAEEIRRTREGY